MSKILKARMWLEKHYSDKCLFERNPLIEKGGRVFSVSPTQLFYHIGKFPFGKDDKAYRELNKKAHFGIRLEIEKEVGEIINWEDLNLGYFFEMKNTLGQLTIDEINNILMKNKIKTIGKNKYNRLMKLFKRWTEESTKCHFKITGARKRLHRKWRNLKNERNKNLSLYI